MQYVLYFMKKEDNIIMEVIQINAISNNTKKQYIGIS